MFLGLSIKVWEAMGGPFLPPLHETRMSSGLVGLPFLEMKFFLGLCMQSLHGAMSIESSIMTGCG